jgi:hypothetical protein
MTRKYAKRNVLTAQNKEIYDFYKDSGQKKMQSYLATYFSEKFGTQIQRQVITGIIGTPETFSNLPMEALRRKIISLTSTSEQAFNRFLNIYSYY